MNSAFQCDEKWPICSQCEKSKRDCPGPLTPFIYETGRLTASKRSDLESSAATEPRTYPLRNSTSLRSSPGPRSRKSTSVLPFDHDSACPTTSSVPLAVCPKASELLAADFIQMLQATHGTGHAFNFIGEYMSLVPVRLGHCAALDAAADCLLFAYQGLLSSHSKHEEGQLSRYIHALRELRIKLDSGRSNEEIVGAALMICAFEVIKRTRKTPDYAAHAGGVVAVLKAVGPEGFTSEFGHAIFHANCGPVVSRQNLPAFCTRTDQCVLGSFRSHRAFSPRLTASSPLLSGLVYSELLGLTTFATHLMGRSTRSWLLYQRSCV